MKYAILSLSLSALLAGCSAPAYDQVDNKANTSGNVAADDDNSSNDTTPDDNNLGGNNASDNTTPDDNAGNNIPEDDTSADAVADKNAQLLAYWTDNVSQDITQSYCIVCHSDASIARDTNWVLLGNNQDDYLTTNLARTLSYIDTAEGNAQLLVDKAQGNNHGGGQVLLAESEAITSWSEFMELASSELVTNPDVPSNDNNNSTSSESRQAAVDFYVANLENALIQPDCYVCHQSNGVAKNSEIIFVGSNVNEYASFNANMVIDYTRASQNNENNFLLKPIGQNHGGNKIIDVSSLHAQNISSFLDLVEQVVDTAEITINTPSNPQASVLIKQAFIAWEMTGDHDGFEVERQQAAGQWNKVATLEKDSNLYRDDSVIAGQDYQYRIRAKLAEDFSDYTTPLSVSIN